MMGRGVRLAVLFLWAIVGAGRGGVFTVMAADVNKAKPQVTCFFGDSESFLTSGQRVGRSKLIVKRTLDPAQKTITEQVITVDSRSDVPAREFMVTMLVDGARFTMTERNNAFSGDGGLVGEPWKWTGWHSHALIPDGSTIDSEDVLTKEGLKVTKTYSGPDGSVRMTFNEMLAPITEKEFHELRARAFGPRSTKRARPAKKP